jgi:hypothetical protein
MYKMYNQQSKSTVLKLVGVPPPPNGWHDEISEALTFLKSTETWKPYFWLFNFN